MFWPPIAAIIREPCYCKDTSGVSYVLQHDQLWSKHRASKTMDIHIIKNKRSLIPQGAGRQLFTFLSFKI